MLTLYIYKVKNILLRHTENYYFSLLLLVHFFERYEASRMDPWKLTEKYSVNAMKNDRFKKGTLPAGSALLKN